MKKHLLLGAGLSVVAAGFLALAPSAFAAVPSVVSVKLTGPSVLLQRRSAGELSPCGQVTKGTWGMSWRQEPMKGVEDCDKPGVVVKRALIPGFLNYCMLNS